MKKNNISLSNRNSVLLALITQTISDILSVKVKEQNRGNASGAQYPDLPVYLTQLVISPPNEVGSGAVEIEVKGLFEVLRWSAIRQPGNRPKFEAKAMFIGRKPTSLAVKVSNCNLLNCDAIITNVFNKSRQTSVEYKTLTELF